MNRGDVVVVPVPYQDQPGAKIRPAVVVQGDAENRRLGNTILAMITGNLFLYPRGMTSWRTMAPTS
jgi:mRNA-degrading endonuclease toxin of MazEF toxin-antitoxin module